jgi:subtilisin family serine protease
MMRLGARHALALASALLPLAVSATAVKHDLGQGAQSVELPMQSTALQVGLDGRAGVVIVLKGEAAARAYGRTLREGGGGAVAKATAGNASRAAVGKRIAEQASFMGQLNRSGVHYQELYRVQRAMNAIAVRMKPSDMQKVRALPGVERVEFLPLDTPDNITSVPFINAPAVWGGSSLLNLPFDATGTGIRVGVIDTGIDYQHPDFGGTGTLADYQANDRTTIGDTIGGNPIFPTAKVVGGYDFAGDAYNANTGTPPAPDDDPMDCLGHGSHVAGTVAGYGENADGTTYTGGFYPAPSPAGLRIGPGVAPGAQLYALRVFGCGGSTNLTVQAIDWATDPNGDDDLSDHLDVINMSLGSSFGLDFDASAAASDAAAEAGVIVVASAGNSGDTFFIHGSPGASPRTISAAAITDDGTSGLRVRVTAPTPNFGYDAAAAGFTNLSGTPVPGPNGQTNELVLVDDGSGATATQGCNTTFANAAALNGKFALIDRGTCSFLPKALNAQANGALGVVVANNVANAALSTMVGDAPTSGPDLVIPSVFVSLESGNALKALMNEGAITVALDPNAPKPDLADTIASFSSRGPGGANGTMRLKPDVAAPGFNIPSVQTGITCTGATGSKGCITPDASGFIADGQLLRLNGTSMAAPHVAGMMALLRQINPDLSVEQIKAIAMNSAAHDAFPSAVNTPPVEIGSRVGSGRVDAALAAQGNQLIAYNADDPGTVSVTFNIEPVGTTTQTRTVTLFNPTDTLRHVHFDIQTVGDAPGVDFSVVDIANIAVPPGHTNPVSVQVAADSSLMRRAHDPTLATTQAVSSDVFAFGARPRHYLGEESARLILSDQFTHEVLAQVPLYVATRPRSDLSTPDNTGMGLPKSGSVDLPITGSDLCTDGSSPGACAANLSTDFESLVSAFELQVTAPLDESLPGFANIRYAGANFDAANGIYTFGIATWGKWNTPTDVAFDICIDTDGDSNFDRMVFATNTGTLNSILGNSQSATDVFMNGRITAAGSVSSGLYLNLSSAAADTALLDNNVMMMAASKGQLNNVTAFNYGIAVCPGFDPLCAFASLTTPTCNAVDAYASFPGPYHYDSAQKSVDTSAGGDWLMEDLAGTTLPVGYNTDNMPVNGSLGLLLLHHHNQSSNSAQVVIIDELFKDGFGQ